MTLRTKFILPLFITVVMLGLAGGLLIRSQLTAFQAQLLRSIAEEKSREVDTAIRTLAGQGLEKAALFSRRPDVIEAYELAHMGDIESETDPLVQQAREALRAKLNDDLSGFKQISGKHFRGRVRSRCRPCWFRGGPWRGWRVSPG